jgi:glycosyltransferase involved in cell wall biosynthesis
MSAPFVSVLIDTYNHECFIADAVNSVLAQDFPASQREILVVDDGSTDSTPKILRKFEPHVRILRKVNGGQASAFNYGIPQCRGEIVAFLDGDDWWASTKLTRVVQAMTVDPAIGIVGHGIVSMHRDGSKLTETLREGFRFQANTMAGARLFSRRGSFMGTSRMTIRAALLQKIGPVPEEIKIQADEYLFTLASALSVMEILPEALTYYRLHGANIFQFASNDPKKLRHKQKSLAILARSLFEKLASYGIDPHVSQVIVAYAQTSADQLRLMLDGGWSWETVGTEWKLYGIVHPDAGFSQRLFKVATLAGALLVPPTTYYKVRQTVAQSSSYVRLRQRWLPIPHMKHVKTEEQKRS